MFKERICEGSYGKISKVIDVRNKHRPLVVKIQHDKEQYDSECLMLEQIKNKFDQEVLKEI